MASCSVRGLDCADACMRACLELPTIVLTMLDRELNGCVARVQAWVTGKVAKPTATAVPPTTWFAGASSIAAIQDLTLSARSRAPCEHVTGPLLSAAQPGITKITCDQSGARLSVRAACLQSCGQAAARMQSQRAAVRRHCQPLANVHHAAAASMRIRTRSSVSFKA